MFHVSVSGWFAAAHQLRIRGVLEPLHGHNWLVRACFCGAELDDDGLLADFVALRGALDAVLKRFHDRNLNELPAFAGRNPSAERVAQVIAAELADAGAGVRLKYVEVEEAPGCLARCYPPQGGCAGR